MKKYLCIHCHFYQPPRENPWLEQVEIQDSAFPYHDWNERVTAECYAPNTAARIVDGQGKILEIVDNYTRVSFNFGPTLFSWMEQRRPEIYQRILEADRISVGERTGHGNALAQGYNHIIMPLATRRDKITQIRWGAADFEHRFSRRPEGIWLPETAVDLETLGILAEEGIRFTLLSPVQARRIRKLSGGEWQDVSGGKIDPTRAYRLLLPNQRFIDLFFYDGPISHAVAFEKVLGRGEEFVARIQEGFSDGRDWTQLLSVATDGESYGHHFPHGDMALAYTLRQIEMKKSALLTNYGEYLAKSPPAHEVEIYEKSSWSCAHGVARWKEDCGCRIGTQPGWNQAWRAPLRQGLDELKSSLDRFYEEAGGGYFRDPWEARDGYIEVILKRNREVAEAFLARHQKKDLAAQEKVVVLKLLEAQRHALLMFTSCGWFFDDISGVEAVQNLTYAARAIELAREVEVSVRGKSETDWEGALLSRLAQAKSNVSEFKDGAEIYRKKVNPLRVDLKRVVAHCAINALFHSPPQSSVFYTQELRMEEDHTLRSGEATLVTGRVRVISRVTFEEEEAVWAALYLGGGEVCGGLRWRDGQQGYAEVQAQLSDRLLQGSLPEMIREMDRQFGENRFDLSELLIEERRRVLEEIVHRAYVPIKEVQQRLYADQRRLMKALVDARMKPPIEFLLAAEYVLNQEIDGLLDRFEEIEVQRRLVEIFREATLWDVPLERDGLRQRILIRLEEKVSGLIKNWDDETPFLEVHRLLDLADMLSLPLDLWKVQNLFHRLIREVAHPSLPLSRLGSRLSFSIPVGESK